MPCIDLLPTQHMACVMYVWTRPGRLAQLAHIAWSMHIACPSQSLHQHSSASTESTHAGRRLAVAGRGRGNGRPEQMAPHAVAFGMRCARASSAPPPPVCEPRRRWAVRRGLTPIYSASESRCPRRRARLFCLALPALPSAAVTFT